MVEHKSEYTHPQTFFVGIDGSEYAEAAFKICKRGLFRESCDKLVLGHIRNKEKHYLAWNFKPEYIQEIYETRLLDIGKKGEFAITDVFDDKPTKECLFNLAQERHATVIVTGMQGRKGIKE